MMMNTYGRGIMTINPNFRFHQEAFYFLKLKKRSEPDKYRTVDQTDIRFDDNLYWVYVTFYVLNTFFKHESQSNTFHSPPCRLGC